MRRLEQDGYEQAPDTVRRPTLLRGTPKASRPRDGDAEKI
jgi:hypothetical protein